MDFFESQERARRNSAWLVALFFLGVAATVLSFHLVVSLVVEGGWRDPALFAGTTGGVLAIILLGMLVKSVQMSHGGPAVAAALGGRQVDPGSVFGCEWCLVIVL
jgi:uncharacterized membrane protein YhaH (DUF805 family)